MILKRSLTKVNSPTLAVLSASLAVRRAISTSSSTTLARSSLGLLSSAAIRAQIFIEGGLRLVADVDGRLADHPAHDPEHELALVSHQMVDVTQPRLPVVLADGRLRFGRVVLQLVDIAGLDDRAKAERLALLRRGVGERPAYGAGVASKVQTSGGLDCGALPGKFGGVGHLAHLHLLHINPQ